MTNATSAMMARLNRNALRVFIRRSTAYRTCVNVRSDLKKMGSLRRRRLFGRICWSCLSLMIYQRYPVLHAQSSDRAGMTGEQLFKRACAACHAADGKGQPRDVRAFETEPPDFTDCRQTTPEADLDWNSIIHLGGRARSFNRIMPSFADELDDQEIARIIGHLRTFCTEPGWPRGDLNL